MCERQVAHAREDGRGLFPIILLGEKARGLVAEGDTDCEEDGRQGLHCDGHDPARIAGAVEKGAVVDPESYHGTAGLEELVEACQDAAKGARRIFGDIRRCYHCGSAETEAGDKSR